MPSALLLTSSSGIPPRVVRTLTGGGSNRSSLRATPPSAALPVDVLSGFPSHQRPSFSDIQGLAVKGLLQTTDDGIVLLVRQLRPTRLTVRALWDAQLVY